MGEDIVHAGPSSSSLPQALFSISIVKLLLFRVRQDLVGKADLLKLKEQRQKDLRNQQNRQDCPDKHAPKSKFLTRDLACAPISALHPPQGQIKPKMTPPLGASYLVSSFRILVRMVLFSQLAIGL